MPLEQLLAEGRNVSEKLGLKAIPALEMNTTDPPDIPLQAATVSLKLQIEHPDSATRRKLRRAIKTDCLSRYTLQKTDGEYRLTIPYEDEADLAWQMDWLRGEMVELAESHGGAINVELREVELRKQW
jgi:hypothetical protein